MVAFLWMAISRVFVFSARDFVVWVFMVLRSGRHYLIIVYLRTMCDHHPNVFCGCSCLTAAPTAPPPFPPTAGFDSCFAPTIAFAFPGDFSDFSEHASITLAARHLPLPELPPTAVERSPHSPRRARKVGGDDGDGGDDDG